MRNQRIFTNDGWDTMWTRKGINLGIHSLINDGKRDGKSELGTGIYSIKINN